MCLLTAAEMFNFLINTCLLSWLKLKAAGRKDHVCIGSALHLGHLGLGWY